MAAEGPNKAEEAAAPALAVKDVAEGNAVVPAPAPAAGDSMALVVVDSEYLLSPCLELYGSSSSAV
jgi:hypothetical protein